MSGKVFATSTLDSLLSSVCVLLVPSPVTFVHNIPSPELYYKHNTIDVSECRSIVVFMLQTYLNGHVLNLFRALSAGAQVDEFEQILATASGITQSHAEHDVNNVRNRCRLVQLGLLNGPLEKIKASLTAVCLTSVQYKY
jgi:hypothetical protein